MAAQAFQRELREEGIEGARERIRVLQGTIPLCELGQPPPSTVRGDLEYLTRAAAAEASLQPAVDELRRRFAALGCPATAAAPASGSGGGPPSPRIPAAAPPGPPAAGAAAAVGGRAVRGPAAGVEGFQVDQRIVSLGEFEMSSGESRYSALEVFPAGTVATIRRLGTYARTRAEVEEEESKLVGWVTLARAGQPLFRLEGAEEAGRPAAETPARAAEQSRGGGRSVDAVAAFLRPGADRDGAQRDEVRLLAMEGRLQDELSRFPSFAVPRAGQLLMRACDDQQLRAWDEQDDAAVETSRRFALLELHGEIAHLREVALEVHEMVQAGQEGLDQIEADMAAARDATEQVVAFLKGPSNCSVMRLFVPPVCAFLVTGMAVAGAAPACCVACLAVRGMVVATATATTGIGTAQLAKWQQRALATMKEHLPLALAPLPEDKRAMLKAAGDEAQRRLLAKLADEPSWTSKLSTSAMIRSLPLRQRPSDARGAVGAAYRTELKLDMPASQVFQAVRHLALQGSLDPGSEVVWSCPVDDEGTYIRYLVFAKWWMNREFFCICRCAKVDAAAAAAAAADARDPESAGRPRAGTAPLLQGAAPADGGGAEECYVFAVTSMGPRLTEVAGFPQAAATAQTGRIYVAGVVVRGLSGGGCQLEVMADVDPASPTSGASLPIPSLLQEAPVEREIRLHVLQVAEAVRAEAKRATSQAPPAPPTVPAGPPRDRSSTA